MHALATLVSLTIRKSDTLEELNPVIPTSDTPAQLRLLHNPSKPDANCVGLRRNAASRGQKSLHLAALNKLRSESVQGKRYGRGSTLDRKELRLTSIRSAQRCIRVLNALLRSMDANQVVERIEP